MFRSEKTRVGAPAKPAIWADGRQFAPFEIDSWARVSGILARRSAAATLGQTSNTCASLAFGLEEGRWKLDLTRLGRAALILPSRLSVARGLARFSRVQAMAAEIVDHHSEEIAPLEIQDLSAFMQSRRAVAARLAAVKLKAEAARPPRPIRPVQGGSRPAAPQTDPASEAPTETLSPLDAFLASTRVESAPSPAEAPEHAARPSVSDEELIAIRLALASAPEPASAVHFPGALADHPVPKIAPRTVFSTASSTWYDEDLAPAEPVPDALPSAKVRNRFADLSLRLFRWVVAVLGRGLLALWRPVRGAIAKAFATLLGWSAVVLALPFGGVRATILHFQHVDLRYFD